MRGVKNHKVSVDKYYIVTTDIITKKNYSILNTYFNTEREAQAIIDNSKLRTRKYYNQVLKGDEVIKFGFVFKKNTRGKPDEYKDMTKYVYPKDITSSAKRKVHRNSMRVKYQRTLKNKK